MAWQDSQKSSEIVGLVGWFVFAEQLTVTGRFFSQCSSPQPMEYWSLWRQIGNQMDDDMRWNIMAQLTSWNIFSLRDAFCDRLHFCQRSWKLWFLLTCVQVFVFIQQPFFFQSRKECYIAQFFRACLQIDLVFIISLFLSPQAKWGQKALSLLWWY